MTSQIPLWVMKGIAMCQSAYKCAFVYWFLYALWGQNHSANFGCSYVNRFFLILRVPVESSQKSIWWHPDELSLKGCRRIDLCKPLVIFKFYGRFQLLAHIDFKLGKVFKSIYVISYLRQITAGYFMLE